MMTENALIQLAEQLAQELTTRGLKIATAESCTGGLMAQVMTSVPGSSIWFECGFITYSNAAKMRMLGVKQKTLQRYGAVSAETVAEMAVGALLKSDADVAIAVSGIAGPDGGSDAKPAGTVYLALQIQHSQNMVWNELFMGDRQSVREQAAATAFTMISSKIQAF